MKRCALCMLALVISLCVLQESGHAGVRSRRTSNRLRCCIPNYGYTNHRPGLRTVVESLPAISPNATRPSGASRAINSKVFVIPNSTAGPVRMSAAAATIYDTGLLRFNCRLNYVSAKSATTTVGQPAVPIPRPRFDVIPGRQCVIRVQGIRRLGTVDAATNGTVLFEVTRTVRVTESNAAASFMIPATDPQRIGLHFGEISHLRVYVHSLQDR